MSYKTGSGLSRRNFIRLSSAAAGMALFPAISCSRGTVPAPMKRRFGKINFDVTTMALGGQASLQWTPDDVEPENIIVKALDLGINYFDTSNLYGPSQMNFGKAFRKKNLIPGQSGYDRQLRESIFITSKTLIRWAKGGYPTLPNVNNRTNGDHGEGAVADLKRSLSQIFGSDDGTYPEGAYVDMFMLHGIGTFEEVDVVYRGLETPLDRDGNFGALVALRDFRDGTNITGLNPKNEKLIRHLGLSGHDNAPMIELIQRDRWDLMDGMLIVINVNDRRYFNTQYNVIPVAQARNMGIIGMKVFARGALFNNKPWEGPKVPGDVIRTVGTDMVPSKPLIEYVLTARGMHTIIAGIGEVNSDPLKCQLLQNYYAAQIDADALSEEARREIEKIGTRAHGGETNYFQPACRGLTPPGNVKIAKTDKIRLTWDTSYAGDEPIARYEIVRDGVIAGTVEHRPQTSKVPFAFEASSGNEFKVVAVDAAGRKAESELLIS